jgi:energy-coupling factor transporter ATP-binding protein EcfA2
MSWQAPPRLVGVAGPDGSGKSTLAVGLARARPPGAPAAPTLYLYGCVVCRHWRGHPLHAAAPAVDGQPAGLIQNWLRSFHALLDATEMTTRLVAGVWLARAAGRRLVITDRTPLDALVKHDPCPRSLTGRWYLALARSYRALLWLDADSAILAARDGEHPASELAAIRARFSIWARRLPNVVRLETGASAPAEVCDRGVRAAGV